VYEKVFAAFCFLHFQNFFLLFPLFKWQAKVFVFGVTSVLLKGMIMKISLRLLLVGIALFSFSTIGCGGGGSDGAVADKTSTSNNNIFYSNPTDSRVVTLADEESDSTYTYNGDIDSNGQLTELTSVVVKDPEIEGDIIYFLDDTGFPHLIQTSGFSFELEPISDSRMRLTLVSQAGDLRVNMPLQLEMGAVAGTGRELYGENEVRTLQNSTQSENRGANMYVTLTKCGKPVEDAVISVEIEPQIGTSNPIGIHVGSGRYAFFIPSSVNPNTDLLKKCDEIPETLAQICQYKLPLQLAAPFISTCDDLAEKVAVFKPGSESVVKKYCRPALLKHLPKLIETLCNQQMMQEIKNACKWNIILNEPEKNHTFALKIKIPGSEAYYTEEVSFSPNELSEWSTEAQNEIDLERLYTVPADPQSDEWYTANAAMACPDPDNGTTVTLSVQGSDGYTGSIEDTIKSDTTLSLDVPAAKEPASDITDTITVTAEDQSWSISTLAEQGKTWTIVVQRDAAETGHDQDPGSDDELTWYVWYADNIGLNPVMVGTNKSFASDTLCSSYPGGGTSPTTLMEKIAIVKNAESKEKAIEAACSQFTNIRPVPGSSTFIYTNWLADRNGERHDIDELDGCQ
jgi:hypothetical protein